MDLNLNTLIQCVNLEYLLMYVYHFYVKYVLSAICSLDVYYKIKFDLELLYLALYDLTKHYDKTRVEVAVGVEVAGKTVNIVTT